MESVDLELKSATSLATKRTEESASRKTSASPQSGGRQTPKAKLEAPLPVPSPAESGAKGVFAANDVLNGIRQWRIPRLRALGFAGADLRVRICVQICVQIYV